MKKKLRTLFAYVTLLLAFYQPSFAYALPEPGGNAFRLTDPNQQMLQKGSVYVYGDQSLDNLIAIRVLGAVAKAGVHYVPAQTDLLTLLSLAGGTTEKAELTELTIRRETKGQSKIIKVNLEKEVADARSTPIILQANDTLLVPQTSVLFSENTMRAITLVTGFATVFSAVVIGVVQIRR